MEKLKNQWLIQNNILVQNVKRKLLEYGYRGQEDLPANTIRSLLESSIIEISRLQRELDSVNEEVKQLKSTDTVTKKDGE